MQRCVLEKLICPVCGNLYLEVFCFADYNDNIIKDGVLLCGTCKSCFTIINRLLELTPLPLVDKEERKHFFNKYNKEINNLGLKISNNIDAKDFNFTDQIKQQKHFDWCTESGKQNYFSYEETPFWQAVDKLVFGDWRKSISKKGWLLDIGCAQGRSAFKLIDLDIQIVGFDISKSMVKEIIKRAEKSGHSQHSSFFVADASSIPIKPEAFDYILVYGVLHHLPKPRETVREIDRILKPGGRLFSLENNKTIFRSIFDLLMKIKPIWLEEAGKEPLISEKMIKKWANNTSLKVKTESKVFIPPHLLNMFDIERAYKIFKSTEKIFNSIPYIKNQGGLIKIEAEKENK